ncbi:hypothetical protein PspS34_06985 [Pseudomonas sp. S34]|nr:hypothetical protein PspS34_06985 [Pseudomonas sp. S34]
MGAGLLAKASCQSIPLLPDTPLSRASPLPQGFACFPTGLGDRDSRQNPLSSPPFEMRRAWAIYFLSR